VTVPHQARGTTHRMFRPALLGLAVLGCLVLAAPKAGACECLSSRAFPVWPIQEATNVALDATFVVAVSDVAGADYRLTDETGGDVPLTVTRALEADDEGCALYDYVFLRPSGDLSPGRRYSLTPSFPGIEPAQAIVTSSTFTTGFSRRGLFVSPPVELSLFAENIAAERWLQVFALAMTEEAVFLRAVGERTAVVQALGGLAPEVPSGIPLGNVPCASLELVDATGSTFRTANLCEPSRCRTSLVYVDTTCGGNPGGDSWARWQEIPDGCTTNPSTPGGNGCAVAGGDRPEWFTPAAIFALFAFLLSRPRVSSARVRRTPLRNVRYERRHSGGAQPKLSLTGFLGSTARSLDMTRST
jgi:hypothetical protein